MVTIRFTCVCLLHRVRGTVEPRILLEICTYLAHTSKTGAKKNNIEKKKDSIHCRHCRPSMGESEAKSERKGSQWRFKHWSVLYQCSSKKINVVLCEFIFVLFFVFTSHPCVVGDVKSVNSIETQFSALISSIRSYTHSGDICWIAKRSDGCEY